MKSGPLEVRIYRALLRAYPPSFRERHGPEMVRAFVSRLEEVRDREGALGLARLWGATLLDVTRNATALRWAALRDAATAGPGLRQDLRYALRSLAKSPGFAAVAVVTLALGIGANTAIFSVVNTVLLRPLPYEEPEELVLLWGEMTNRGVTEFPHSPPDFRDYQRESTLFEGIAAVVTFPQPVGGEDGDPEQIETGAVSWNFFDVLGVEPALGRDFAPEDAEPGEPQPGQPPGFSPPATAILSHRLWQQRYGADPDVLGRRIDVAGFPVTVVGVLPPDFALHMPPDAGLARNAELWTALRLDYDATPRGNVFLSVVGRLKDGVTLEQARTEMDRIAGLARERFQGWETAGFGLDVVFMHEHLTRSVRPLLWALMGAVAFVLLIACANVSNLLLVRATTRERELAIRRAVGGTRGRLVRQMLLESGLLALAGAVLGLAVARGGIDLLTALRPEDLPRLDAVSLDAGVLGFTVAVAGIAALLFGTLPALHGTRSHLAESLRDRGASGDAGRVRTLRSGVVVGEVALCLVLLIGAGLMVRSFASLQDVDPGFRPEGVLTFSLTLPQPRYPLPADRARMNRQLLERLGSIPGVEAVGAALPLPLSGQAMNGRYGPEEALAEPERFRQADYRAVLPGYFRAMGTRLLEGRTFTAADEADSAAVVVVDEVLAERMWPGESAVGKRFVVRVTTPEPQWVEVVGVVEHQRHASLAEEGRETIFYPDRFVGSFGQLTWTLRSSGPPLSVLEAARREVHALDPRIPLADVRPMENYVREAMAPTRFTLILIGAFGAVALILASVGLYGVLAYTVRQRTAEFGVRMAFGAGSRSILGMVVRRGMALTAVGVGVGVLAAMGLTRLMSGLLVGVAPTDPLTYLGISLLFLAVAAGACLLPALRATRVDPATALREE